MAILCVYFGLLFSLVPVFANLKIRWMTYSCFCGFLQIRKHTSDERSDGIFGFARRKIVGDHGRVPGVLGLLGPRVIV